MSMFIDAKQDFPADCREKWQRQVIPLSRDFNRFIFTLTNGCSE